MPDPVTPARPAVDPRGRCDNCGRPFAVGESYFGLGEPMARLCRACAGRRKEATREPE